jgi:hypothetical protein
MSRRDGDKMKKRSLAVPFVALLLAGCFENSSCQTGCVNLSISKSDTADTIDTKLKSMCEAMGLKGKPEITERSDDMVSAHCPP